MVPTKHQLLREQVPWPAPSRLRERSRTGELQRFIMDSESGWQDTKQDTTSTSKIPSRSQH